MADRKLLYNPPAASQKLDLTRLLSMSKPHLASKHLRNVIHLWQKICTFLFTQSNSNIPLKPPFKPGNYRNCHYLFSLINTERNVLINYAKDVKECCFSHVGSQTCPHKQLSLCAFVRCLPFFGSGSSLRVLVTHIACVCMSTFPKARQNDGKVSHLQSVFTRITVFPHM